MKEQSKTGNIGITIVLGVFSLLEAIALGLIASGHFPFVGGNEKSATEQGPPGISADGIELKQTSQLTPEQCVQGSQRALLARGFRPGARTDRTIAMSKRNVVAMVRCRNDAIVMSAAGFDGADMEGTVAEMRGAIREELRGDVRVE